MRARRSHSTLEFGAPWGRCVKGATLLVGMILLGVMSIPFVAQPAKPGSANPAWFAPLLVVLIFGVTSLFAVRGYSVRRRELWIKRLFWQTRIPLNGLQSAQADPEALKGAMRKAGNGGFLAITGWFWSRRLGKFRAFVTDPRRSVLLRFKDRLMVVSPDDPETFITALGVEADSERRS